MEPEEEMEIITDFIMRNRLMETLDEEDDAFTNSFNQSEDKLRRSVSADNLGRETSASFSVSGQWGRMRASIHAVNGLRRRKRKGVHLM